MKYIIRILISAFLVVILARLLPGAKVDDYLTAILVALAISVLNILVKPVLVILTLPVTMITFGFFLLIINTFILLLADALVSGFYIDGFGWALVFSILLSMSQSILFSWLREKERA